MLIHKNQKINRSFIFVFILFIATGFIFPNNIAAQGPPKKAQSITKKNPSFLFLSDIHLNTTTDTTA